MPDVFWLLKPVLQAGLALASRRCEPPAGGEVRLAGLDGPVEVFRDRWGIPHIYAGSLPDLLMAQGFVHAQDRLWQMDFNRRVGAGRLSEVLGASTVKIDRWMRTLTLRRVAEREAVLLDAERRGYLEAYAAGVNARIAQGRLPVEFSLLRYRPEPWCAADTLTWIKVMSLMLSVNWQAEMRRAALVARLGPERAAELEAPYPEGWPIIVPPGLDAARISQAGSPLERAQAAEPFIGPPAGAGLGSNNWVVGGPRTATGKPMLANDMHLSLSIPPIWVENHLCGGGVHITGVTFPGIPGIVSGHTERVAWGFTNGFPDTQDLYVERLRRGDDGRVQVEYEGEWHDAQVLRETIRVKGAQPVVEEVIVTRHGPIVNALAPDLAGEQPLALRWTSLEPDTMIVCLFEIMQARNCLELREALRHWSGPVQNVVYADVDGNIAYSFPGKVPIRARGDGRLPVPGWTSEFEWRGLIPYEELPHLFNPPQGYIVTANNRVVGDDYPYELGREMLMGDRARRIVELIEGGGRLDVAAIRSMHFDQVSPFARVIAARLAGLAVDHPEQAALVRQMGEWDGRLAADSVPAAVEQVFVREMLRLVLTPKLEAGDGQPDLLPHLVGSDRLWHWLVRLLDAPDAFWLDLGGGETRDDVMQMALQRTVQVLTEKLGPEADGWTWGRLHRITWHHPLGEVPALAKLLNRGPYPLGGDGTTVWCTAPESGDYQADQIVGPPYRMIVDLADLRRSVALLAPGQSGVPGSRHYDDRIGDWFAGGYHPMLFAREDVEREACSRLRLTPTKS